MTSPLETKSSCHQRQPYKSPSTTDTNTEGRDTHHDHVGVPAMLVDANVRLPADVGHRVGVGGVELVGEQDAAKLLVEVVVGKDHAVVDGRVGRRAVDVAVEEVVVGRAEGRLDVVVELGDDVRHLAQVGIIVYALERQSGEPSSINVHGSQKEYP